MTSTTTALPICLRGEVCEKCGAERTNGIHSGARPIETSRDHPNPAHGFRTHVCDLSCSVEFWRAMGCDPARGDDGTSARRPVWWCRELVDFDSRTDDKKWAHGDGSGRLADILGDPSSDAAWLAARDVIEIIHQRGWYWLIETDPDPAHNGARVLDGADEYDPLRGQLVFGGALPRVIALAAWSAALQEAE